MDAHPAKATPNQCRLYALKKDGAALALDAAAVAAEFALPEVSAAAGVIGTAYVGAAALGNAMAHQDYRGAGIAYAGRHAGIAEGFFSGGALRLARFISVGALLVSITRDIKQEKKDYENCMAGKEGP